MNCPICNNPTDIKAEECSVCGFNQLTVYSEMCFSDNETIHEWEQKVIFPARALWNSHEHMYEKLLKRYRGLRVKYDELRIQYDSLSRDYAELKKEFDTLESLSPRVPSVDTGTKPGWNTTDFIAHINFATLSYPFWKTTCEISNISAICVSGSSKIRISFLAKKVQDHNGPKSENYIGFNYKVKNADGIIVRTDDWSKSGLCVGDVYKGIIELYNIPTNCVIEFSDKR